MLATAASPDRSRLRAIRILVVDDDVDIRETLHGSLALFGADVDVVDGAAPARALLDLHRYDVLLSDIDMPREDGYSLIRTVRCSCAAAIAAAAVTGRVSPVDRARALDAGFDCVIGKPLDVRVLVDAVCALVGRR